MKGPQDRERPFHVPLTPSASYAEVSELRLLEKRELELEHLRVELQLKEGQLQRSRRAVALMQEELDAKDAELQHALLDLRLAAREAFTAQPQSGGASLSVGSLANGFRR